MIDATEGGQVIFTYDIEWEKSMVKWASRWDVYLQVTIRKVRSPFNCLCEMSRKLTFENVHQMTDDNIHWFSIVNSFVILVFLTGIVALIMLRILRKDFARYNEMALTEEELVEANREMREEVGCVCVCASRCGGACWDQPRDV